MVPSSRRRRNFLIGVLAIAVAAIAIFATWAESEFWGPQGKERSGVRALTGPGITIHTFVRTPTGIATAGDASVTVFSLVPSAMTVSSNWTNRTSNGQLLMFQGNSSSAGLLTGSINLSNWTTVISQWGGAIPATSRSVSLQVESSWQEFNNSSQQWQWYAWQDALAYNPWSPPTSFQESIYFDLSKPAGFLNMSSPNTPAGNPPPPHIICPQNPAPKWTTNYNGYITGPLPVFMVNNTLRTMNPSVAFAETIASTQVTANFTEAGGTDYSGAYTATAGVGTVWGGNDYLNVSGASGDALSQSNASFGVLYLANVTLHVVRQTETLYYYTQPACRLWTTSAQFGTVSVTKVSGSQFDILTAHLPSSYGELLDTITKDYQSVSNNTLSNAHTANWGTLSAAAKGTSSGESLLHKAATVASVILTALGLGLAYMTLADACGPLCGAGDVATAITVVTAIASYLTTILSAISSFSYTVSTTENLTLVQISAVGANFPLDVLSSSFPTGMSTAQGVATAFMPSDIIAW